MFMAMPALSYHSSMDSPDRIEPEVLTRNAVLMGTLLLYCAALGPEEVPRLRELVLEDIESRRRREAGHKKALWDIARAGALAELDRLEGRRGDLSPAEAEELPPLFRRPPREVPAAEAELVPLRLVKGGLTFAARPDFLERPWPPAPERPLNTPVFWGGDDLGTALFWTDGKRNLWQIAVLSWLEGEGAENPRHPSPAEHFHFLKRYFQFLSENGYMRLTGGVKAGPPAGA
jgi:hypothetical protein